MDWNLIRVESTGSTMVDAAEQPVGTVVVAEEQTAGHGRMGRRWHSEPGSGLYLSAVLALPCPANELPVITLALGLAAHEAVQQVAGVVCDLRWPNDLLAGEKKCAGILVQLHGERIVAGIGINVNHSGFPEELASIATSLKVVAGRDIAREPLLTALLQSIDTYHGLLADEGKEPILRLFARASSYVSGRRVVVENPEISLEGTTDGLDEAGFLWVRTDDGRRRLVRAGGVRAG